MQRLTRPLRLAYCRRPMDAPGASLSFGEWTACAVLSAVALAALLACLACLVACSAMDSRRAPVGPINAPAAR